jgi:hypothetical protein
MKCEAVDKTVCEEVKISLTPTEAKKLYQILAKASTLYDLYKALSEIVNK